MFVKADKTIALFALKPGSDLELLLSEILDIFAFLPLDVLWMPCRGEGGATPARVKKIAKMDRKKLYELIKKAYPNPAS
jgi:hypothetical protein